MQECQDTLPRKVVTFKPNSEDPRGSVPTHSMHRRFQANFGGCSTRQRNYGRGGGSREQSFRTNFTNTSRTPHANLTKPLTSCYEHRSPSDTPRQPYNNLITSFHQSLTSSHQTNITSSYPSNIKPSLSNHAIRRPPPRKNFSQRFQDKHQEHMLFSWQDPSRTQTQSHRLKVEKWTRHDVPQGKQGDHHWESVSHLLSFMV